MIVRIVLAVLGTVLLALAGALLAEGDELGALFLFALGVPTVLSLVGAGGRRAPSRREGRWWGDGGGGGGWFDGGGDCGGGGAGGDGGGGGAAQPNSCARCHGSLRRAPRRRLTAVA